MVIFSTQLVLEKYYAICERPQSTFGVFCQFYIFFSVNPTHDTIISHA